MLKADWFKNDITHVLITMVSPLGRVGYRFSRLATIRYKTVFHIIKVDIYYNHVECLKILKGNYMLCIVFMENRHYIIHGTIMLVLFNEDPIYNELRGIIILSNMSRFVY